MRLSSQRGDMTQEYLPSKSRFCGRGIVVWFHGMLAVDRIAERVVLDEHLGRCPSPRRRSWPSRMRICRLISTRSVVTSLPSTTTPGVTNISRPQSVMVL